MDEVVGPFLQTNRTVLHLGVALLLGALIGLERGWESREQQPGERVAGIRTFALVGLLGGIAALLNAQVSAWMLPVMLISVVAIALVGYRERLDHIRNFSITGTIGLILTFCYGAIAVAIDPTIAAAAAVVTTIVLDKKREIHSLVARLQAHELDAALKLLLISVVMLPLLPNTDMGPGGALNPYSIWWMVVLIAAVSFAGYFAMRVAGTEKGILFTSLFAGLSSSTALTLNFARQSRQTPALSPYLAAGILLACGTMFPRILVYCALLNRDLLPLLWWPVLTMTLLLYIPALLIWRRHHNGLTVEQPLTGNPLELQTALVFGALLTGILFCGEILREWFGQAGIFMLAATSGIVDVDAITLSLSRMSQSAIAPSTAVMGIVIAGATNNVVKTVMAALIGSRPLAVRVALPMLLSLGGGLLVAWLLLVGSAH